MSGRPNELRELEEHYKDIIVQAYFHDNHSHRGLNVRQRTLVRFLKHITDKEGLRKQERTEELDSSVQAWITYKFFMDSVSDDFILRHLQARGVAITKTGLARFRLKHGMRRRVDVNNRDDAEAGMERVIDELLAEGTTQTLGIRKAFLFVKQTGYARGFEGGAAQWSVSRDRVFQYIKQIAPHLVEATCPDASIEPPLSHQPHECMSSHS